MLKGTNYPDQTCRKYSSLLNAKRHMVYNLLPCAFTLLFYIRFCALEQNDISGCNGEREGKWQIFGMENGCTDHRVGQDLVIRANGRKEEIL